MGYLSNGKWVTTEDYGKRLTHEILRELEVIFERKYSRRFKESRFNNLSSQEQNNLLHEAGVRVQDRRRGRLIP